MTKKDVLELKKRLKKNDCSITKLCGCYVNGEKEILLHLNETFLNLEDEEFYKYLEIAKKTLSGTLGNQLLELPFPRKEEEAGGKQQFLMGLKETGLKNEELLQTFYQLVIDNYDYSGNYLILIFHDAYDVMRRTSDNSKLDESEEVYDYLLCAICPVTLTKPGLGYLETEHRIGTINRDWVVNAPDTGFVFPAFSDRSSDIHSVLYYTKQPQEPHREIMELVLGCVAKQTGVEQKTLFQEIVHKIIGDEEKGETAFMEIQDTLSLMVEESELLEDGQDPEPLLLTDTSIKEVLTSSGLPDEVVEQIEVSCAENFTNTPVAKHLLDNKVLATSAIKRTERALAEQVFQLQEQLGQVAATKEMDGEFDVVVKVKPEKAEQITSQIIDGKRCIVIPVDNEEQVGVNHGNGVESFN